MKKLLKFLKDDLPLVIAGFALSVSVLLAIINAISRYTLSHVIPGADAVITMCFAYTVYVGSAAAFKRGQHYGVDVFVSRLSVKNKMIVQFTLNILIFIIMCLGFYLSLQLTMNAGYKRFEGLSLPYTVYDMSAVIGFGYSILYAIEFVIADVKQLFRREATA